MAQSMVFPTSESPEFERALGLERIEDRDELVAFMMKDRFANAYLLGKLDPSYVNFCRWFGQRGPSGELQRILLHYLGLSIPVAFWIGEDLSDHPEFFRAGRAVIPERHHFHVIGDQMSAVREHFHVTSCQKMHRMGLERASYVRRENDPRVVRLGHRDTAAIMGLYAHYPDHFFEPYQMESGLYFGVRDEEDELVSIAGVHVLNVEHDVAVIGNLVTHPDARGKGLATACTGRLLDELFERVSFVALNVQAQNTPAIRMYTNFGFGPNNVYFEGRVHDE